MGATNARDKASGHLGVGVGAHRVVGQVDVGASKVPQLGGLLGLPGKGRVRHATDPARNHAHPSLAARNGLPHCPAGHAISARCGAPPWCSQPRGPGSPRTRLARFGCYAAQAQRHWRQLKRTCNPVRQTSRRLRATGLSRASLPAEGPQQKGAESAASPVKPPLKETRLPGHRSAPGSRN